MPSKYVTTVSGDAYNNEMPEAYTLQFVLQLPLMLRFCTMSTPSEHHRSCQMGQWEAYGPHSDG